MNGVQPQSNAAATADGQQEDPLPGAERVDAAPADVLLTVRSGEEYAAAFDMEVWKAEQRRAFDVSLQRELERRRHELDLDFAARDVQRLEEVDALRRELEAMAKRLHSTGGVLSKRIVNLEKREEAFEARRLQLARDAEEQLHLMESRHRRVLDEAYLKHENLASQLRERDMVTQQANQKLHTLQQEYDALQRLVGRLQSRESSEAITIADLRKRSETLAGSMRDLQQQLEQKNDALAACAHERDELAAACRMYKDQVRQLTTAYNALSQSVDAQRDRFFAEEKERLAAVAREQDLCAMQQQPHRGGGSMHARNTLRSDALAAQYLNAQQGAMLDGTAPSAMAGAEYPATEIGALKQLVHQLKDEAAREERRQADAEKRMSKERRKRERHDARRRAANGAVGATLQYAEVAAPVGAAPVFNTDARVAGRSVSPLRVTGSVGEVLFGHPDNGDGRYHRGTAPRTVEDDAQSSTTTPADDMVSLSTLSSHRYHRHDAAGGGGGGAQDTVGASLPGGVSVNTSTESVGGSFPYVVPPSFSTLEDRDASSYGTPSLHGHDVRRSDPSTTSDTAPKMPSASASTFSAPDAMVLDDAALPDMRAFVERLKENRQRLLETGVYAEEDPLMQDMNKKIRVYEHYLGAHFM